MRTSSASTEPFAADRRRLSVGLAALVSAVLVGVGNRVRVGITGTPWTMLDLGVYRWGGEQVRLGGDLYGSFFPASATIPGYAGGDLPFTYTPVSAVAFVPLSWVSFGLAQPIALLVNATALAVIVSVAWRALGHRAGAGRTVPTVVGLTAAALVLEPVLQNVAFGQINLVLVALCLWDLCLPDEHPAKGAGVGLATAVKLAPAIFIVFLAVTGRRRAAVRAVVVAAGATLAAAAVLPEASTRYWLGGTFRAAERVGRPEYAGNQSLNGLVTRLAGGGGVATVVGLALAAVVAVAGLTAAARLHRRGHALAAIVVVALTGLLVSPISWTHHWVWIVPAAVLLVDAVRRRVPWARWLLAAGFAAFVAPGIIWQVPADSGRELHWNAAQVAAGNLYVWLALAAVAGAVAVTARSEPRTAPRRRAAPAGAGPPAGWPARGGPRSRSAGS